MIQMGDSEKQERMMNHQGEIRQTELGAIMKQEIIITS